MEAAECSVFAALWWSQVGPAPLKLLRCAGLIDHVTLADVTSFLIASALSLYCERISRK